MLKCSIAGLSLIGGTVLCPWASLEGLCDDLEQDISASVFCTGLAQELHRHYLKWFTGT